PVKPAARPAAPADSAHLAALAERARGEFESQRGGHLFNVREGGDGDGRDGERWVGMLGDVVVGFAAARVEELADGSRLGGITALFVEPEARAVGVGECLVRSIVEWCDEQGCTGIDAAALPGARAAKNFFEESGFTARLLIMHHRLPPAGRG
ncbi:MAG TPA: GNAT family N-acetyltransferase, partial [Thermoleophilia bacterium]|nr:GNAT family N-acetyltransferase [Thermoleophilia bacterium]